MPADMEANDLAAELRPALLRLTRAVRSQRADVTVTLAQLSVLATLQKKGPLGAGGLAAAEQVQPPTLTKILADLSDRKLIRRDGNPDDRRQAIISIAQPGAKLLERERRLRNEWLSTRLAQLDPADRALVTAVIPVLSKLVQQ